MADVTQALRVIGLWSEFADPAGRSYFYNSQTGATQWEAPPEFSAPPPSVPRVSGPWTEFADPTGKLYYHNAETNTTQWEAPPEFCSSLGHLGPAPAAAVGDLLSISVHGVTGEELLSGFRVTTASTVGEIRLALQDAHPLTNEYCWRLLWNGVEVQTTDQIGNVGLYDGCSLCAVKDVNPALSRTRVLEPGLNADEVCSADGSECPSE
mmetsp:Transcript_150694/g.288725  ORF Transcript_150694/g.288725 Transcript_150694/m.288725 type:complete len:209 (+) Transcript_150694:88-714(+)